MPESPLNSTPAARPQPIHIEGRFVSLAPLDPAAHAEPLYEAVRGHDKIWDYMSDGPYPTLAAFREGLERKAATLDPLFFAITDRKTGAALAYASLMRIEPAHRVIEVGNILYPPAFQKTRGATEALYLMARHVFDDLGYRRYEWKCNDRNAPSRRAALRLGFRFEGIFRQHMIIKGHNRDTAWFAMLDSDWPARKAAFEKWVSPDSFDAMGIQRQSLAKLA